MFEVGFTELLVIFVLALVVLGPEKLPRLAAQVGRWIGRARSMAKQFRDQLEDEVNVADLNKWQQPASSTSTPGTAAPGTEPPTTMADPPVASGTPESPVEAGFHDASGHDEGVHHSGAHNSGPPPEPEAAVYEPPAYATARDPAHGSASSESAHAVESAPSESHTPIKSHDSAATSEERPARPGDVITQTHERGI